MVTEYIYTAAEVAAMAALVGYKVTTVTERDSEADGLVQVTANAHIQVGRGYLVVAHELDDEDASELSPLFEGEGQIRAALQYLKAKESLADVYTRVRHKALKDNGE
jgi:hypothetical protein